MSPSLLYGISVIKVNVAAAFLWFVTFIALSDFVVDQTQAVKFALDIACGMAFLHTLEPMIPRHYLNSKSVMVGQSCGCSRCPVVTYDEQTRKLQEREMMSDGSRSPLFPQIDEDMTARISMADVKFSFQCPGRMYSPAWVAPEGTHHSHSTDPEWQLEPFRLKREWWMQGAQN